MAPLITTAVADTSPPPGPPPLLPGRGMNIVFDVCLHEVIVSEKQAIKIVDKQIFANAFIITPHIFDVTEKREGRVNMKSMRAEDP
ncbi:MAG: hypothetical protein JXA07_16380 [Spirochaetes bacterium]|nr:hypothetical protein [Spirochaetota bacterium]